MARPVKVSLDYFACDVRILDDPKIALVMAEHGPGVANVVIRLLGEIYGGEGYFLAWDDDRATLFAFNTCHGAVSPDEAKAIVQSLIKRGFFDAETFARTGKLTSHGIQARWEMAIKTTHRTCQIDPGICLLERPKTVSSEETIVNSEETPISSEKTTPNKRKEKKSNYLQTNKPPRACEAGRAGGQYAQSELTAAVRADGAQTTTPRKRSPLLRDTDDSPPPSKKPPGNPLRNEIVRILVKPGDYSIDRDLIDRTYKAIRDGVPGLDPDNLRKISRKADEAVKLYDRTDGRRGKQYRWQTIADEIHARFRAANRPWSDEFAGENEPPPAASRRGHYAQGQSPAAVRDDVAQTEEPPDADELIARLRDRKTDAAAAATEAAQAVSAPVADGQLNLNPPVAEVPTEKTKIMDDHALLKETWMDQKRAADYLKDIRQLAADIRGAVQNQTAGAAAFAD